MNQPSAFQVQHPLSPRKFWKKMLGRVLPDLFYSAVLGSIVTIGIYLGNAVLFNSYSETDPIDFGNVFFVGIIVILIIFLAISLLYAWYVKVYIRRYYYDCGEQFITIKKGVFAPTEIHVQYQKIQDVYVDQDIIDRIMGLYDVHIASATITSGIEAHIDGVSAEVAENLKNIILAKIHGVSKTNDPAIIPEPKLQQNPVQFNQKISSDTYPISSRWIWSAFASAVITGLSFTLFLGFISIGLADDIDLSFNTVAFWLTVVFFVGFLYRIIWLSIWKTNYSFEFLPEFILLRTGVISRQENHLPYKSIQNVLNTQGVIDRMLGLSTVVIQNAAMHMVSTSRGQAVAVGSGISLVWQTPAKAQELNDIVNSIVVKINPKNSNNMMGL